MYGVKRVNPEVHKIYIRRIGFSLIRVHRQQTYTSSTNSNELLLQQLKWPIEYLMVGLKIKNYHAGTTSALKTQHLDKWHTFHSRATGTYNTTGQNVLYEQELVVTSAGTETLGIAQAVFTAASEDTPALTGTAVLAVAVAKGDLIKIGGMLLTVETAAAAAAAVTGVTVYTGPIDDTDFAASTANAQGARKLTMQGLQVEVEQCTKTFVDMTVKAHGISLYDNLPEGFFNCYTAYHYGGPNINTPEDCGLAFIPFCLYPGTYQPSGHINVSRSREFYLNWNSTGISSSVEATLVVIASAINFLLISDKLELSQESGNRFLVFIKLIFWVLN